MIELCCSHLFQNQKSRLHSMTMDEASVLCYNLLQIYPTNFSEPTLHICNPIRSQPEAVMPNTRFESRPVPVHRHQMTAPYLPVCKHLLHKQGADQTSKQVNQRIITRFLDDSWVDTAKSSHMITSAPRRANETRPRAWRRV